MLWGLEFRQATDFRLLMQYPFTQCVEEGRSQRKREIKLTPTFCPDCWRPHSPFSPWEKLFVSHTGLWCIVFLRGASTGGLLIAVSQTIRPGPATEEDRVTTAACPSPRLCLEREHSHSTAPPLHKSSPSPKRGGPIQESWDWTGYSGDISAPSPLGGAQRTWV